MHSQKKSMTPVPVFISYAPQDEAFCEHLLAHLSILVRQQWITTCHKHQILPGVNWQQEIHVSLEQAAIFLLLISSDFFASDYCYSVEMQRVLEHHQRKSARVIPILLRDCDWQSSPLGHLKHLPLNGISIQAATNPDAQWKQIVDELRALLEYQNHMGNPAPFSSPTETFHVPYRPNPFFTGREEILKQIRTQLCMNQPIALSQPQAICGLGGIGKTRIAIEYAYQFHQEYKHVFWARAESHEALISSYVDIADQLNLQIQASPNQTIIVQVVKDWLQKPQNKQWLLILDNADEIDLIDETFLPPSPQGHIILTTRSLAVGPLARRLEIKTLSLEEGAFFLLRRCGFIANNQTLEQALVRPDWKWAQEISQELEGLPLALDQAGAYIEATNEDLCSYLRIFRKYGTKLLKERQAHMYDHPDSVVRTFSLCFERVTQKNSSAANLLRFCAYLAPDAIAEEIIRKSAAFLGPEFQATASDELLFNEAIKVLRTYSLINRDPDTKTISIHRLVQAVLRDSMTKEMGQLWKERAVNAINATFPNPEKLLWASCENQLPHALVCASWIHQEKMTHLQATQLLSLTGNYLRERARYDEAQPFLEDALTINQQREGKEAPQVAASMNNLAYLFWSQGKYQQAEPLFQNALTIRQKCFNKNNPDIGESLHNLGCLYQTLGRLERSTSLLQSAMEIAKQTHDPILAVYQSNLAEVYRKQGKYAESKDLLDKALATYTQQKKQEDINTARICHKQGLLAYQQGKLKEASSWFQRTRRMYEEYLGNEHPNTAQILNALAEIARVEGRFEESESLFQRALDIKINYFGIMHSSTAATLNGLGLLYVQQGKYIFEKKEQSHSHFKEGRLQEAKKHFRKALTIRRRVFGEDHLNTAVIKNNLACVYLAYDQYDKKAEKLLQEALHTYEKISGYDNTEMLQVLYNLIYLYYAQERDTEVQSLAERAKVIHETLRNQKHPQAGMIQRENVFILEMLHTFEEATPFTHGFLSDEPSS